MNQTIIDVFPNVYSQFQRTSSFYTLCPQGLMFAKNRKEITDEQIVAIFCYIQSFLIFMSVAAVPAIMMQNVVFVRERSNGLVDTFPFVLSNFVNTLFIHAIISAAFSSLIVQMMGLRNHLSFILNIFLFLLCGESIMHILSAVTPHYIIGIMFLKIAKVFTNVCPLFLVGAFLGKSARHLQ